MEPDVDAMYAAGQIREAKYQAYKRTLAECAAKLGE